MRRLLFILRPTPFRLAAPVVVLASLFQLTSLVNVSHLPAMAWVETVRSMHTAWENKYLDMKFNWRAPDVEESAVVLAAVDDKSLKELGRWPWPRDVVADIVRHLDLWGAKVIAMDMVFDTEDSSGGYRLVQDILTHTQQLRKPAMEKALTPFLTKKLVETNADQRLIDSVKATNKVVLGYFWYTHEEEFPQANMNFDDALFQISPSLLQPSMVGAADEKRGLEGSWFRPVGVVTNRAELSDASPHHAYFNATSDEDGIFRKQPLFAEFEKTFFPSLPLKAVSLYLGKTPEIRIHANSGYSQVTQVKLEGIEPIPVDHAGMLRLNWRGPARSFPYYSAVDIARGRSEITETRYDPRTGSDVAQSVNPEKALKNKIVILGATAIGAGDVRHTPVAGTYPGPEIHATAIDNILRGNYVHNDEATVVNFASSMLLGGLLLSWLFSRLRALSGSLLLFAAIAAYTLLDFYYFFQMKQQINPVLLPLMMIMGSSFVITIFKFMTEERERSRVKGAFQKYVSPAIVDEMLRDPTKLKLEGEKRELTVLFSDIRGFTTISEKLDAGQVSEFLNQYLSPMTDLVFDHSGTLDKYMGDAIMAFWGAPVPFEDHALKACQCALRMIERLESLQKEFRLKGYPQIDIGIGLNTGEMSVGNMGSNKIFSYTVLGDSVNLASRLEGINKTYGTHIIVSEFTHAVVKDALFSREVDRVRVKGKKHPVRIYELLGERTRTLPAEIQSVSEAFARGYSLYSERRWAEAGQAFEEGLKIKANDGPSLAYVERCQYLKAHDPGEHWDGTWNMTSK